MTEDERFAIFWCFNNAMKYMEIDEFDERKDVIVNGINITETVGKLLQDRLFV
jgi:hypothetical protein